MTTGIDFDDFPEVAEADAKAAREDAENALVWFNNDEKTIQAELSGFVNRITDFMKHLEKMVENRDFYATYNGWKALALNDFGPGGWIPSFIKKNTGVLTFPRDRIMLANAEEVKAYEACKKYFDDLSLLSKTCELFAQLWNEQFIVAVYDRLTWIENVKRGGYDKKFYDQICKDTKFFSDLFATDPARIPDPKAKAFYRDYQDRLIAGEKGKEPDELKAEYRAERRKDYQDYVRKGNLSHCFKENSNGTYSMVAGWESRISVIDRYTSNITSRHPPFMDDVDEQIGKIKDTLEKNITANDKELGLKETQSVNRTLRKLMDTIIAFAQKGVDTIDLFADSDEAPYVWMQVPDELDNAVANYEFKPVKDYPWGRGTSYEKLYEGALKSLKIQGDFFVEKCGEDHLRDK